MGNPRIALIVKTIRIHISTSALLSHSILNYCSPKYFHSSQLICVIFIPYKPSIYRLHLYSISIINIHLLCWLILWGCNGVNLFYAIYIITYRELISTVVVVTSRYGNDDNNFQIHYSTHKAKPDTVCEIALRWMPQNRTNEKSTLV